MTLFLPEAVLLGMTLILLCFSVMRNMLDPLRLRRVMLALCVVLLFSCAGTLHTSGALFSGTYQVDGLSQAFKTLLALGLLFTVLLSQRMISIPPSRNAEYYVFLSTATLGMMMLPSSADLLVLYVAMELSSYSLYVLTALKKDSKNAESSVKYLIFGAAASAVFLWGLSFFLGLAGTSSLPEISRNLPALTAQPVFLLGLAFMIFAFLFKLSSVPFHFWAPDVYETAATPVTNFIATASKAAAVAVLVRICLWTGMTPQIVTLLGVLSFASMTLGNTVALVQKDIKRLLAYSSIAQAGYILLGVLAGTAEGYSSTFFYTVAYLLMNTAVFLVVVVLARSTRHDNPALSHFDGLAERSPILALLLLLGLLSLAGIPPLAGFTGKWFLFTAAMQKGHWFLVLWAVLNSVVSLFYYLTIVKHAYLERPQTNAPIELSISVRLLCAALFAAIILLGLYPTPLIEFSQQLLKGPVLS